MKEDKRYSRSDIFLRSRQVEELMTKIPPYFIRWGITVIMIIFLGLLGTSIFIKYPEIISGDVKLELKGDQYNCRIYVEENKLMFINKGQAVYIRLISFPAEKYGSINGYIKQTDSLEYRNNGYYVPVLIKLSKKQQHFFEKKLINMNGTGDIVVREVTLFRKIIENTYAN
ncbi:MAG: hypothetical protein KBH21_05315 [Acetoanaerobium sp.]|nr:hypothetical protein [Acetoanaerobium sp.]